MEIIQIPIENLKVSSDNTRKDLVSGTDEVDINNLAESIVKFGLLNPLIVIKTDKYYEIIAGQRRFLACQKNNMGTIPCIIKNDIDSTEALGISLIENIQRADMNPLDKSSAYKQLLDLLKDIEKLSKFIGVGIPTIRKYLHLQNLSYNIKKQIDSREGTLGIETLSRISKDFSDHMDQDILFNHIQHFNQKTQIEIIKKLNGDLSEIKGITEDARNGLFDITVCTRGLCNIIPEDFEKVLQEELLKKRKITWVEFFTRVANSAANVAAHTATNAVISGIDLTKLGGH